MRYIGFTSGKLTENNLLPVVKTAKTAKKNITMHEITLNAAIPVNFLKKIKHRKRYVYDFVLSQCKQYIIEIFDTLENAIIYKNSDSTIISSEHFAYKCLRKIHETHKIKFLVSFYIIGEKYLFATLEGESHKYVKIIYVLCEYQPEKDKCVIHNVDNIIFDNTKTILLYKNLDSVGELYLLYKDNGKLITGRVQSQNILFDEINSVLATYTPFEDGTVFYEKYKVRMDLGFLDIIKDKIYKIKECKDELEEKMIGEYLVFYCDHKLYVFDINGLFYKIDMYHYIKSKDKIKKIEIERMYNFISKDKKYTLINFALRLYGHDLIKYNEILLVFYEKSGSRNLICGVPLTRYKETGKAVYGIHKTLLLISCIEDYNKRICAIDMIFDYLKGNISSRNRIIAFDINTLEYYPMNFIQGEINIMNVRNKRIARINVKKCLYKDDEALIYTMNDIARDNPGYHIVYLEDKWIPVLWHTYETERNNTIYYAPEYNRTIIPVNDTQSVIYTAQNGYNRYIMITAGQNNN